MEDQPSPTRESNLDREFRVALFDDVMDRYQAGEITYEQALGEYTIGVIAQIDSPPPEEKHE